MKKAIGIDIGGTNIKGVLINGEGEILKQIKAKTYSGSDPNWQKNIKSVFDEFKQGIEESTILVGISAPGLANETNTAISFLPNRLSGMENFIWSDYLNTKTKVLNDAHAALMAEHSFGSLKNFQNAILITLGTGVGGALLLEGKLHQGSSQMAGHIGHTILQPHNFQQSLLGMPGSLEYALGNYSIEQRSHGKFKNTFALLEAVDRKETFAQWLWLDMMRNLSLSVCSLINTFSPEAIVLAGGLTHAGDHLFKTLDDFITLYEFRPKGKKTQILQAKYMDFSGALGAAAFALKK
ncbi:ROK family protein [Algoriphagus sp. SE2]|uniref:ROK family protein n=1 Tax=Algoriphagus sp. SE2 TaxID=3141536 RepID=UPI0031CD60F4